jgi:hypothetical protein
MHRRVLLLAACLAAVAAVADVPGIPATACFEQYDRAGLELPGDADPEVVTCYVREYAVPQAA